MNPFHDAYETSLSKLSETEWRAMSSHWSMFSGFSFCRKIGRKWTVEGFGFKTSPLFDTKRAAEEYATNLLLAEGRWRRHQEWEAEHKAAQFASEPTEQGNQLVIPGCEKDKTRGPKQMDLF